MKKMKKKIDKEKEDVITHLQIIRTWAAFALERDLQFFTAKHFEKMVSWMDDALALLINNLHDDTIARLKEQQKIIDEIMQRWANNGYFD